MFTRITGDQKRYVEELKFTIIDDCKMGDAEDSDDYCKVGAALVHLGTFYKEMYTGDDDVMVQQVVKPVKRTCVQIKIEEAALRCLVKKYSRKYPDRTFDQLVEFLQRRYRRDLTKYMDIINNAWSIQLVSIPTQLV
jgi:hypothetical protein